MILTRKKEKFVIHKRRNKKQSLFYSVLYHTSIEWEFVHTKCASKKRLFDLMQYCGKIHFLNSTLFSFLENSPSILSAYFYCQEGSLVCNDWHFRVRAQFWSRTYPWLLEGVEILPVSWHLSDGHFWIAHFLCSNLHLANVWHIV